MLIQRLGALSNADQWNQNRLILKFQWRQRVQQSVQWRLRSHVVMWNIADQNSIWIWNQCPGNLSGGPIGRHKWCRYSTCRKFVLHDLSIFLDWRFRWWSIPGNSSVIVITEPVVEGYIVILHDKQFVGIVCIHLCLSFLPDNHTLIFRRRWDWIWILLDWCQNLDNHNTP